VPAPEPVKPGDGASAIAIGRGSELGLGKGGQREQSHANDRLKPDERREEREMLRNMGSEGVKGVVGLKDASGKPNFRESGRN